MFTGYLLHEEDMVTSSVGTHAAQAPGRHVTEGAWRTTLIASLGALAAYVPVTAVTTALPSIARSLHTSSSSLQWVSDALVIPMAAFILSAGVFGDVHGRRKVFLAGLTLTAAGSIVGLLAGRVEVLWLADAVLGIGAAAVIPSSLALISHAVHDHHERGRHIAVWATALAVGMAVGAISAGGLLRAAGGWRVAYVPCLVVALVGVIAGLWGVEDSRSPVARHLDWAGQVLGTAAVLGLVYGVIEGASAGWTGSRSIAGFAVAAVAIILFVVAELRSTSPLLDLRIFTSPAFTGACLVAMVAMFGLIGLIYVLSLFLGGVQHLDGLEIAYRLVIYFGFNAVAGLVVGRLMHLIRPRLLMAIGLVVIAGGMAWMTNIDASSGLRSEAARLLVISGGFSLVFTTMTAAAVSSVDHHLAGMASAAINAIRQVGGAFGPAVLGAILAARETAHLKGALAAHGVSSADGSAALAVAHAHGFNAAAAMASGPTAAAFADSATYAMHVCAVVAAVTMVLAAVAALALRPRVVLVPVADSIGV